MSGSPSFPRSKRQKIDKTGRFSALEKFRDLKQSGSKHKCDVGEVVDNVYETVDEKEYSKRVLSRANDDWIEDDDAEHGYIEDGREIFDDDDDDHYANSAHSTKEPRKRNRDSVVAVGKSKGSIKNMFSSVALKKKDVDVNIANDNVLADILCELRDGSEIKLNSVAQTTVKPSRNTIIPRDPVITETFRNTTNDEQTNDIPNVIEEITDEFKTEGDFNTAKEPDLAMDYSFLDEKDNQFEDFVHDNNINPKEGTISDNITDNWEKLCGMGSTQDDSMLNEIESEEFYASKETKMWLWDAWEDSLKRPGEIFLFGTIRDGKDYKSVTVHVENVDRCLYLLPRKHRNGTTEKVSMMDVHEEFSSLIVSKLDLDEFRSRKVAKCFSFSVPGLAVPHFSDYMQVEYEGKRAVPENHGKYKTIAHIFGTTNSALETFLLGRKIKGPCWITIKDFRVRERPLSWCKKELTCPNVKCIDVATERNQGPPPISILTLHVRVAMNSNNMKNEIIMICGLVNTRFPVDKAPPSPQFTRHFCYFTKPTNSNWPYDINQKLATSKTTAQKFNTERELLSFFLNQFQTIDPDLLVAHDSDDCQLNIICDRICDLKIPLWSRIGRLRMTNVAGKNYFSGRLICDVKHSAEELIKSRSYDLGTLCQQVLNLKCGDRMDLNYDQMLHMYESSDDILKLISSTMLDTSYILRLMCELNVLPLALQITNICGNLMSRTLQGGRSKRNEYLLLHAFHEKNYIVPDGLVKDRSRYENGKDSATRKKAAYSGGLVLEPLKGFYDKFILVMDFNSLYPSIIQEYNICYTTIDAPVTENEEVGVPDPSVEQGVLPFQIRRLVESRREVKKLMANPDLEPDQQMQYNIRQLALKLTANSMYGCLGFDKSRFYAPHLAALVTQKGRDILLNTKSLVQKLNLEVIYGDTDSIMVNTNCSDIDLVSKVGQDIKQVVNKIYKHVELDIDAVFKYLLLLKKKKYAAVLALKNKSGEIQYRQEHKGLDIVRRDWSQISVMAGRVILDELLSDRQMDEKIENVHSKLEKFRNNIENGYTPLHLLSITKQLTKQPKEYSNAKSLPHVQVALRMNATMHTRFKRGDMVDYIICLDGTDNQAMQRAYHIDEIKANADLKVDNEYYLAQQIHPVVSRLVEPIEGTDSSQIAVCLGLDASKFKAAIKRTEHLDRTILFPPTELYSDCEKFRFNCVSCKGQNQVMGPVKAMNGKLACVLQSCNNIECTARPLDYLPQLRNVLFKLIRQCVSRYYGNYLTCDETTCNNSTRIYTHVMVNKKMLCDACGMGNLYPQYTATDLYNQINYWHYVFDMKQHNLSKVRLSTDEKDGLDYLRDTASAFLARCNYSTVNLRKVFQPFHPIRDLHDTVMEEVEQE